MAIEKRKGRWQSGQSGNPAGRPKGSSAVSKLRESLIDDIPSILQQLVVQAREGDIGAARLLLERTMPATKPVEMPVEVNLPTEGGLSTQAQAIVTAIASGILSPAQGAQIITALAGVARLRETDDLSRRIEILEGKDAEQT